MSKNDFLEHIGVGWDHNPPGVGSSRYPHGSGENPYQHQNDFLTAYEHLKAKGLTEKEIADGMGLSVRQLRAKKSIAVNERRSFNIDTANKLWNKFDKNGDHVYTKSEIARMMGTTESNVRNYLNPSIKNRNEVLNTTADTLKAAVEKMDYIDVGSGVERYMNISKEKLRAAVEILKESEGYQTINIQVQQINNPRQKTSVLVLCKKDATYKEVNQAAVEDKVRLIGQSFNKNEETNYMQFPVSINSDRVLIRYAEDGGKNKDGVIELRRGVEDLDLGQSRYAQVRIAVDNSHYLKGMAIYADDVPKGYDVIFNTNKSKEGNTKLDVLKEFKKDKKTGEVDKFNPFGTTLQVVGGQSTYVGKDGKKHLSAINKVNEEGNWAEWSKTLSSQILSKQDVPLIKKQLTLSLKEKQQEYEEIMAVTNPVIRSKLLESFADDCDSSAVHLKAAALPRQASHVILPLTSIKENEIFAPNYRQGEKVVLFRHPHAGTFEIAELTVNNNNPEGKRLIGSSSRDAVGINPKVAPILSGADFDGDSVIVVPTRGISININKPSKSSPLKELQDFDPNIYAYPKGDTHPKMKDRTKGLEMGKVSNLITDMTLRGANDDELARAVKHSMVVIDAQKHDLNYKQSYKDNRIKELEKKYQDQGNGKFGGASTLISRAKSSYRVDERREQPGTIGIDPKTGEKVYYYTGKTYFDKKTGKYVKRQIESTKMAEAKDARELSSGHPKEEIYASYANELKALANKSRLNILNAESYHYNAAAKETYKKEVDSLDAQLRIAEMNAPRERQAQLIANSRVALAKAADPNMEKDEIKKLGQQSLAAARVRVGADKTRIKITDDEWKAISAGAISKNKLESIMRNTDLDLLKQYATPREYSSVMTPAKIARAEAMLAGGYTQADVADLFGISVSTLMRSIRGN